MQAPPPPHTPLRTWNGIENYARKTWCSFEERCQPLVGAADVEIVLFLSFLTIILILVTRADFHFKLIVVYVIIAFQNQS